MTKPQIPIPTFDPLAWLREGLAIGAGMGHHDDSLYILFTERMRANHRTEQGRRREHAWFIEMAAHEDEITRYLTRIVPPGSPVTRETLELAA